MEEVLENIMNFIKESISGMNNYDAKQTLEDVQVEIDELLETYN